MQMEEINVKDIQNIYKMLNWENADKIRAEGFCLAKKIEDLSKKITYSYSIKKA